MAEDPPFMITKSSGERAPYDEKRLRRSLERSGARPELIDTICARVREMLYDGIPTRDIYRKAFSILRSSSRPSAARYKLKRAIFELGPSGYPFERFVAALLDHEGYKTSVGRIVKGKCVSHEVDVIASKNDRHYAVECKFHRDSGNYCDVKIPLYIHSRFMDFRNRKEKPEQPDEDFSEGWIVTNTRFTSDAMQYGTCAGLRLIGWKYPDNGSLNQRIDAAGLHPVTCLTTLTKTEKQRLLENGVTLCTEICRFPAHLKRASIPEKKHKAVLKEARDVCESSL